MRIARWWSLCAFGALTLFVSSAPADDNKDREHGKGHMPPVVSAAAGSGSGASASSAAAGDAGVGKGKETAEPKKRRVDYTLGTGNKIRSMLHKDKKQITAEEKAVIKTHWRIAMRLLKIQRVAEAASKPEKAKKAADLLAKEDARFYAKLEQLNKAAPATSASASASAGAPTPKPTAAPAASGGAK